MAIRYGRNTCTASPTSFCTYFLQFRRLLKTHLSAPGDSGFVNILTYLLTCLYQNVITLYIHFISPNCGSKNTDTYRHIYTHTSKQIYINTQIIYIYIRPSTWRQLNWITWQPLFHSLDKYKPNLTPNCCMRLAMQF